MARLRWIQKYQQRPKESFFIICAYIPTARAPAGVKSRLLEQLQDILDGVPNSDFLVIVRDLMLKLVCSILKMICGIVVWVGMELKKEILLVRTLTILSV